jgi:hypothetical protein
MQGAGHQNEARRLALPSTWRPVERPDLARGKGPDLRCRSRPLGGLPRGPIARAVTVRGLLQGRGISDQYAQARETIKMEGLMTQTVVRKRGRPSAYTPELADLICRRLNEVESLRAICRSPGMPSAGAVLGWVEKRPEFRRQYDLARRFAVETIADEMLERRA